MPLNHITTTRLEEQLRGLAHFTDAAAEAQIVKQRVGGKAGTPVWGIRILASWAGSRGPTSMGWVWLILKCLWVLRMQAVFSEKDAFQEETISQ